MVTGFDYILHKIEPEEIHEVLGHFREAAKQINSSIYGRIIEAQTDTVEVIRKLIPKRQKIIPFGGIDTGLKWLFGTMDETDRRNIEEHLAVVDTNNHNLIEGKNRQVKINNKFNEVVSHIKQLVKGDRKLIQNLLANYSELKREVVSDELHREKNS